MEQIRNKLQTVELPDIEHAWGEMSLLMSPVRLEADRLWIRKTLLRLIGLNVLVGLVVSLFAILPVDNEKLKSSHGRTADSLNTESMVQESQAIQPTQVAEYSSLSRPDLLDSSERNRPLSLSEIGHWQLDGLPYPNFEFKITPQDHLEASSRSTLVEIKPVYSIRPYGFITYGAFPEVRSSDWKNQFGLVTGVRIHSDGYSSVDLNFEYTPVSIRTLDLRLPNDPASGSDRIRSYKRINYICAGIGIDRRINGSVNLNGGVQFGRVLSASGSEILRESGTGSVLQTTDNVRWRNPEGIRPTDLSLVAGIEFKLKHGKALIRYRQSLRDHSMDEQFGSGTFNSYGLIQFGIGHSLNF
ncbi:MAG: hypothetical protein H6606_03470 [Flavobacteriales bacterium]|nr:hypothetical protein [Flavobacteriales bacterium]